MDEDEWRVQVLRRLETITQGVAFIAVVVALGVVALIATMIG